MGQIAFKNGSLIKTVSLADFDDDYGYVDKYAIGCGSIDDFATNVGHNVARTRNDGCR